MLRWVLPQRMIQVVCHCGPSEQVKSLVEEVLQVGLREEANELLLTLYNSRCPTTVARGKLQAKCVIRFEKKARDHEEKRERQVSPAASSSHPSLHRTIGMDFSSNALTGKDDGWLILLTDSKTTDIAIRRELINKRRNHGGCTRGGHTLCYWNNTMQEKL